MDHTSVELSEDVRAILAKVKAKEPQGVYIEMERQLREAAARNEPLHPSIAWQRAGRRVNGARFASAATLAATPFNSRTR